MFGVGISTNCAIVHKDCNANMCVPYRNFCLRNILFVYKLYVIIHYVIQRWRTTVQDTCASTKSCLGVIIDALKDNREPAK